jgi:beta-phosphoglucomutase
VNVRVAQPLVPRTSYQRLSTQHSGLSTKLVLEREAQQHETADHHEGKKDDHQQRTGERGLFLAAEAPDGEHEDDDPDAADDPADECHADEGMLKVGIHGGKVTTMERPDDFPPRVAAAIFDFDETMIDLEPQHTFAFEALCREMNADYLQMPESWRCSSGRRVIDDVRDLRRFFGWSKPVDELFAIRQQHFDDACRTAPLELLPGVEQTVRALQALGACAEERLPQAETSARTSATNAAGGAGLALAITSSAVGGSIDSILRRLGMRDAFALIVDGSRVTHGKPDPEAYLLTASLLGVAPRACIVFEDSHVGVAAAKAAGMYCIAVRNPHAQLPQDLGSADVVLDSFEQFEATWVGTAGSADRSSPGDHLR